MLSMYAISRGTNKLNLKTAKKPLISRPIFARLTQIWGPKRFSLILPLLNVAYSSYHCVQFQGKLMIQTQENGENLILGLI